MSEVLAALPLLAVAVLLVIVIAVQCRRARQEARRRKAVARHPSRRHARLRAVPGLEDDGRPLTEDELREYTELMFRAASKRGRQGTS